MVQVKTPGSQPGNRGESSNPREILNAPLAQLARALEANLKSPVRVGYGAFNSSNIKANNFVRLLNEVSER